MTMKIKRKQDAVDVIHKLVASEGGIALWSYPVTSRSIVRIVEVYGYGFYVMYHEDFIGEDWVQFHYPAELVDVIWDNRKFINQSGQISDL
jgi:hypothetical protein